MSRGDRSSGFDKHDCNDDEEFLDVGLSGDQYAHGVASSFFSSRAISRALAHDYFIHEVSLENTTRTEQTTNHCATHAGGGDILTGQIELF